VVLTNSDDGLLVVYDVTQRVLGGAAYWDIFNDAKDRAANTKFQKDIHSSYVWIYMIDWRDIEVSLDI